SLSRQVGGFGARAPHVAADQHADDEHCDGRYPSPPEAGRSYLRGGGRGSVADLGGEIERGQGGWCRTLTAAAIAGVIKDLKLLVLAIAVHRPNLRSPQPNRNS